MTMKQETIHPVPENLEVSRKSEESALRPGSDQLKEPSHSLQEIADTQDGELDIVYMVGPRFWFIIAS